MCGAAFDRLCVKTLPSATVIETGRGTVSARRLLFLHHVLYNANHGHQDPATDAAASDLGYD
jgi:hypothetical protein